MCKSLDEAIGHLSIGAHGREFIRNSYFDDDVLVAAEHFTKSEEWRETKKVLSNYMTGHVLDLGAGRGIATYAFLTAGCEVTAVEPMASDFLGRGAIQDLLMRSKRKAAVVESQAETLPFADASFDVVYCRQVLHHIRDLDRAFSEISRVLRRGGVFFAAREHVVDSKQSLQEFLRNHPVHQLVGGEGAYTLDQYRNAMIKAGLSINFVLGSYESCINYAPSGERVVVEKCIRLLMPLIGYRASSWLLKPGSFHGSALTSVLAKYASKIDKYPGRLNSFCCKR